MKKIIAIMAVGVCLSLQADYLYWMVDTTSAANYAPYTAVRLMSVGDTTPIDEYEFSAASDLIAYQAELGGYFTSEGEFGSSQSFFVELLNGDTWKAQSGTKTYEQLLAAGSIFKSGSIAPATATATPFGTYAVPEPTSGLLFLVGGMLLGLKRRRQKV